jgi:hypothetical protein
MDSLTDERNIWFNAVRSEDSHDYSSATILYLEDATRCLTRNMFSRAAMSATCAASCLVNLEDFGDAVDLYSVSASLYERNADLVVGRSIRESLWMLIHAYEYYVFVSDHVGSERVSRKYVELASRVDRFDTRSISDVLNSRKENVQIAKSKLEPSSEVSPRNSIPDFQKIQHSIRSFLQLVRSVDSQEEPDHLVYESESDFNEARIVS